MWDLPRPGIEPVSLSLQGIILTTGPPGYPRPLFLLCNSSFPFSTCNIFSSFPKQITMFNHLSCFTLHYKICLKYSVLPCNLYTLPWNSLTLWIFSAMLRFPPNINLQIAYVIVDDTDVYQPHGSLFFFLSNGCFKCFVLCDIQFHLHNILEVKSIIIPIYRRGHWDTEQWCDKYPWLVKDRARRQTQVVSF